MLVLQAKHRAIQRPNSYLSLIKTQRYITLTKHTDNLQQKNIPSGHKHAHVTLTTTQLQASQESSALQTEKLEVAASKGAAQAAGTQC